MDRQGFDALRDVLETDHTPATQRKIVAILLGSVKALIERVDELEARVGPRGDAHAGPH
jgi:hypothetical protein